MSGKHTPDIAELLPDRQYRCEHCSDQVFGNQSHYHLHMRRRHRLIAINHLATVSAYHCPVQKCIYHAECRGGRSFTSLKLLRQHYQKMHMDKKFKCNTCNETFLLAHHLEKHLCCTSYPCPVCGLTYSSKTGLQTHMRRKKHLPTPSPSEVPIKPPPKDKSSKVAILSLSAWKKLEANSVSAKSPSLSTEKTPSEAPINVPTIENKPTTDSPMQPSYYCFPDIEIPYALQTATQTEDSIDMNVAIHPTSHVNELHMPNFTDEEVERLLRDMETQTDDVDLDELDINHEGLVPLLRDIQTQTLDYRQNQGTMTELELDMKTQTEQPNSNYAPYEEQDVQTLAHMHTQTCDELFEELGLSHIQTQTHWPDGLYNTQHTQTCDEMLDELLENFQSTCTQTRWLDD